MQFVQEKKIKLVIGSFIVDCTSDDMDLMAKGMLMMWGVFSEMERDIISQRVKSGMQNAKAKGKKIGRPKMDASNPPDKFYKYYPLYRSKQLTATAFARVVGCSRKTKYNNLFHYENTHGNEYV